jgi:hypothetical protein
LSAQTLIRFTQNALEVDKILHIRRLYGYHLIWLVVVYFFFINEFPFGHALRRDGFLELFGFTILVMVLCWLFYPWQSSTPSSLVGSLTALFLVAFVVTFFQNSIQNRIIGDFFGLCCLEKCYIRGGSSLVLAKVVFWTPIFGGFFVFAKLWDRFFV